MLSFRGQPGVLHWDYFMTLLWMIVNRGEAETPGANRGNILTVLASVFPWGCGLFRVRIRH